MLLYVAVLLLLLDEMLSSFVCDPSATAASGLSDPAAEGADSAAIDAVVVVGAAGVSTVAEAAVAEVVAADVS